MDGYALHVPARQARFGQNGVELDEYLSRLFGTRTSSDPSRISNETLRNKKSTKLDPLAHATYFSARRAWAFVESQDNDRKSYQKSTYVDQCCSISVHDGVCGARSTKSERNAGRREPPFEIEGLKVQRALMIYILMEQLILSNIWKFYCILVLCSVHSLPFSINVVLPPT